MRLPEWPTTRPFGLRYAFVGPGHTDPISHAMQIIKTTEQNDYTDSRVILK
ncbi:hypothetical protein WOLCODRAFT_147460 [Wolfiporia cocos MD-104 SS10]|uniref:Uncharacterized protein n=1 Tax=Wolfiporia cocos (strain MD-104) TaxID=742152 RepID=A0A2H3J6T1_WOLCO|nr:hypothetical protein WOLCODRAFT_147460 [Wolfiporia cocos MD-104 SS10]